MKPLTIAGGGLSGLTLGIALRQARIPVTVIEAGRYPRHRVCGEFLSGHGQKILAQLDLLPACHAAGARMAETVRFATSQHLGPLHPLPRPALCLSRYRLDALLADTFERLGGELRIGERATDIAGREGWIQATGRRIAPPGGSWRWFGVKAHARGVSLDADLEMHVAPGSYVGFCRLAEDRVNVCGLFRRRADHGESTPRSPLEWLRGPDGSLRHKRLRQAEFDPDSICTVGGLDLRRHPPSPPGTLVLGDSLTMIPPVSGNGMSLALQSALLAVGPLTAFANGSSSWSRTCDTLNQVHRSAFQRRLLWAGVLQRLLFMPAASTLLFRLLHHSNSAWRLLFAATRE